MKPRTILPFLSAAAVAVALTAGQAGAAISATPGTLLLGFAKVNNDGTGYTGNTYVYSLGAASSYRDGTVSPGLIGNLNTDLAAAFGGGWANDTTLRWGVVGVVGASAGTVNGDGPRTTYYSLNYQGLPEGSEAPVLTSSQRGSLSTNLDSFFGTMNGIAENGAVDGGAFYASNGINSFSSFLPPGPSTSFGVSYSPLTSQDGGSEAGVDLYRTIHTPTGSQTGQYTGSFILSDNGNISYVPEPSSSLLAAATALAGLTRRRRTVRQAL